MPTSVIIPVFNAQETIARTLDSVFASEYPDYEVLVVDDGSQDQTIKILEDWKEKTGYSIKLLRKDHGGKASAANFGAQESRGNFLLFLDADSYVVPDFIEKSLGILEKTKKGAIDYVQQVSNPQTNLWTKVSEFERKLLELHPDNFGALFVIKREIFEKYPFKNSHSPQYEIDIRLLRANLLVFDPSPVVFSDEPEKFRKMIRRKIRWNYGFLEAIQINGFEKRIDKLLFVLRISISFIGFFLVISPLILGIVVNPAFLIFPICVFLVLWAKNIILAIQMGLSLHLSFVFTFYQLYILNLAVIL
ncbi:MAG: glycosyltransferase, partial [Candidatus Thorarchaeota archaeon]